MAIGNALLGTLSGKVGDVVFSRSNGKQIVRSKAQKVSNPRTESQNVQRAIFATVAKASQGLSGIVDHSFQTVKYGQDSVNYFRKRNLDLLRSSYLAGAKLDLLTKGEDSVVANSYLISQGSLPSPIVITTDIANDLNGYYMLAGITPSNPGLTVTLQQLTQKYGIKAGDQLTVVACVNSLDYQNTEEGFGRIVYARVVLLPDLEPDSIVINNGGFSPSACDPNVTTNYQWLRVYQSTGTTPTRVGFSSDLGGMLVDGEEVADAIGLIVSRYSEQDGKWLRSTCRMTVGANVGYVDGDQSAIASYGNSESENSSTEYLNQADSASAPTTAVDDERGNVIFTLTTPDGDVYTDKVKQGGEVTFNMPSLPVESTLSVKATTFSGVKIDESVMVLTNNFDVLKRQMTVSSARKQATGLAFITNAADEQSILNIYVDTISTFNNAARKSVRTSMQISVD